MTGDPADFAVTLDVADESSCQACVAAVVAEFGGLDIVVNNAGVMLLGPIADAETTDWQRMIATNVLGTMYVTRAALPHLLDRQDGRISDVVNVSSVAGRVSAMWTGGYSASKFAVNAFSESLRQEVTTRGVRVAVIEPGVVATELTDHITHPQTKTAAEQLTGSMRVLDAEDVARGVAYIVGQPPHASVNELLIRPSAQQ